jgi:hypothetical protein
LSHRLGKIPRSKVELEPEGATFGAILLDEIDTSQYAPDATPVVFASLKMQGTLPKQRPLEVAYF